MGTQGRGLPQAVQAVENAEVRVICELYTGNIRRAQGLCTNDKVRIVKEWERVVEDKDIDAVAAAGQLPLKETAEPSGRPQACRARA